MLLLINALLIKKAYSIYVSVLSNQQTLHLMLPENRQAVLEQYSNVNRRLQCNLSVLLYISDSYHNKAAAQQGNRIQFPVILSTPPDMPELRQLYKRLQELYPEAIQFLKTKMQHMKQQQENSLLGDMPMSKAQQLQQQMPMLGHAPQKQSRPYLQQVPGSSYSFDINQLNSPLSYDSSLIGLPQSRGQGKISSGHFQ